MREGAPHAVPRTGYGDVVPITRLGKLMGVLWIFAGTLFAAMFSASITSSLVSANVRLNTDSLLLPGVEPLSISCVR